MEIIAICLLILLVGGLLVCTLVLPIVAWARSRRLPQLERKLERLEDEVRRLRRELEARPQALTPAREGAPPPVLEVEADEPEAAAPAGQTVGSTGPTPRIEPLRPARRAVAPPSEAFNAAWFETWLGQRGLGWVAALLFLFATAFFLKYAFDNEWIGPTGQISIGLAVAGSMCLGGYHYHHKGWRVFSQMMTAAGVALLYLASFSAFAYFRLLPQSTGGYFLVVIVAEAAALALLYDAPSIAIMAVVGGLLTPVLMHTDHDRYVALFMYLTVLNVGAAVLAVIRPWPLVAGLALLGTQLLFWGWYDQNYHPEKLAAVLAFQAAIFVLHFGLGVGERAFSSRLVAGLELSRIAVNGFLAAAAAYVLLDGDYHAAMGTLAILFAIAYAGFALLAQVRVPNHPQLQFLATSLALAFAAAAIPLQARAAWIAVGWAAMGFALWWFGMRIRVETLRGMGAVLLTLALGRLVFVDTPYGSRPPFVPIFNNYGLAGLATAMSIIGTAVTTQRWRGRLGPQDGPALVLTSLASVGLVWLILSVEAFGYFTASAGSLDGIYDSQRVGQTALSVVWAVYAVILLAIGFRLHTPLIRWLALGLFVLTLLKVVFLDMADLPGLYRVLAFLALAVMMGAAAWGYQRFQRQRPRGESEVNNHA